MGRVEVIPQTQPKEVLQRVPENTYHLMRSGKEVIDRTIDRINQAKYSIDLQYYTFEADETGERVIKALLTAKQRAKQEGRDLPIRLLADNSIRLFHNGGKPVFLSKEARKKRDETYKRLLDLQQEGIEVKITNYFHFLGLHSNPAYMDHKKIAIFDGKNPDADSDPHYLPTTIIGSANIANYHYVWKDIGVEMTGNMVPIIQRDFDETFQHALDFAPVLDVPTVGKYLERNIIHNPHRLRNLLRIPGDLRTSITRNVESPGWRMQYDLKQTGDGKGGIVATDGDWWSKREATTLGIELLQSLNEGDRIDVIGSFPGMGKPTNEMIAAVSRKPDVHLITSESNSHPLYQRKGKVGPVVLPNPFAAQWERKLKVGGVKLHIFQGENGESVPTIHAKFMLVRRKDGSASVLWGSSNFSFGLISGGNREIVLLTDDPKIVNQFIDLVDNDLTPHSLLQKNGWRRTKAA